MATHICIQSAEGPKERLRGQTDSPVASQVINHRTLMATHTRITTFLCARSSSPICIRGYFFFSSHPPPRGALELELRRCHHTSGLQQSVDTVTSHFLVIPAGNIRRSHGRDQRGEHGGQRDWSRPTINYSKPVFHSSQIT